MSKPWEEEWRAEGASYVERRIDTKTIASVELEVVAGDRVKYTRLMAAAPDMARALRPLAMLPCITEVPCRVAPCPRCAALAALAKAGAPLP